MLRQLDQHIVYACQTLEDVQLLLILSDEVGGGNQLLDICTSFGHHLLLECGQ